MTTKKLVILEIANNHMGDVKHGIYIIKEFSKIIENYTNWFDFAFKFQFRDIDTFIHKDYKNKLDNKYVKRFTETKLSEEKFIILKEKIKKNGFKCICTPFDEPSVELIVKMNFDYIKIASCSFTDWPLLNKIAEYNLPIIASTGGITSFDQIDKVISFFTHRNKDISLLHCVGEYPTWSQNIELNQIDLLKKYKIKIGYSTHENPNEYRVVQMAIAKGVNILEKHIGIETEKYKLNTYSVKPEQLNKWLYSAVEALEICGTENNRHTITNNEKRDLLQFKRGVFTKIDIKKGETIDRSNVYYAWPNIENQILANDMSKYIKYIAETDISKDSPVLNTITTKVDTREKVWEIVQKVKKFLIDSNVVFPGKATLELSHHYGIDKFYETGITMITVVNKDYCKKLIVMLPYQKNPEHYHKIKTETFFVLYGLVKITNNFNNVYCDTFLHKGESIDIESNTKHSFNTNEEGCIIEEISTKHYPDDSFYTDETITNNKNRKTIVNYWL